MEQITIKSFFYISQIHKVEVICGKTPHKNATDNAIESHVERYLGGGK